MLPEMLAWRPMSVLIAFFVGSRCCFARMVCCSRSDARSLFESWTVRRVKTPAALILFRTDTSLLRPASLENESRSRLAICASTLWALPRIEPMGAIAFIFAPSGGWTDDDWDWTLPSSRSSIPDSSYGLYWDRGVVALRYPELMVGSKPEWIPAIHDPVFPNVFSEVTFLHWEKTAR